MDWLSAFSVLNPAGAVGLAERTLMLHAVEFMLIVAVPVYVLLFFFAWQYRASNTRATYMPDWEHAKMDELIWWAIPFEIILILGALTWTSTHALDPRVPLASAGGEPPLVVEVVALEWKWLFIYPAQGIATVNYLALPVGRPVEFRVTADAPMNSFWIPRLGGQIYAMTGMTTRLNLVADYPGVFAGGSANYSGTGFAEMKFAVHAVPQGEFDTWVHDVRAAQTALDTAAYAALAQPSAADAPEYFGAVDEDLYDTIVMRFMYKGGAADSSSSAAGHHGDAAEAESAAPPLAP